LRRESTDAERLLWSRLRGQRLLGYKFRRQHPIGHFIVDFVCTECALVIELDGGQHLERTVEDSARTRVLQDMGYRVIRFWNHQVLTETAAVLAAIREKLEA